MRRRRDLRAGPRVMVLGGTSEIGLALVRALQAHSPREVALVGRDGERLDRSAEELVAHGVIRAITFQLDALDPTAHTSRLSKFDDELGGADIAIVAVGILGAHPGGEEDEASAVEVLRTNMLGAGSLLLAMAAIMRARGAGTIVVLSSVAAERPRRSNAVYGASKAGLDALARGLGDRLWAQGVRVLVVRPGFVFTSMTTGLKPAPMAIDPAGVADEIMRALGKGRQTAHAPRRLRWPMLALRVMPRAILRRIRL